MQPCHSLAGTFCNGNCFCSVQCTVRYGTVRDSASRAHAGLPERLHRITSRKTLCRSLKSQAQAPDPAPPPTYVIPPSEKEINRLARGPSPITCFRPQRLLNGITITGGNHEFKSSIQLIVWPECRNDVLARYS